MSYAIMRVSKLKMGNAAASLSHTFRERETLNADPDRIRENSAFQVLDQAKPPSNTDDALVGLRRRLPESYRKDAVVAVEYLTTTSPEWAEKATKEEQMKFFRASVNWIIKKHGAENVVLSMMHNDEKTPHLVTYVVPISNQNPEKPGRLCAKDFLGGKKKLSDMQTSFHDAVKHLGLERGIEGSTAKHERVQKHYNQIQQEVPQPKVGIDLEDMTRRKTGGPLSKRETNAEMANRINSKMRKQVKAWTDPVIARANVTVSAENKAEEATNTAKRLEREAKAHRELMAGLNPDQKQKLIEYSTQMQSQNQQRKIEQKQQQKGPKLGM